MSATENQLQKSVCQYLAVICPEVLYTAIPNQQVMSGAVRGLCIKLFGEAKGKEYADTIPEPHCRRFEGNRVDLRLHWKSPAGSAKTLYLELKSATGSVKPEQRSLHDRVRAIGIPVEIVRSMRDLQEVIREYGIPSRTVK
jgi:hypothetical protein